MAEHSTIEWTDATWSPWEGCTKVSPACDHCYAEGMNRWLRKGENWGPGAPRRIYSEDHWAKPMKWQRDAPKFHTLHGRSRRVFPSVCDPFDNEAPGLQRERLWATIRATPALTWLLLTKRIGNAKSMLPADWGDGYPNVWLGATVVNQAEADRDVPKLLAAPARVRFLSIEPMLGPITLPAMRCDRGSLPGPGGAGGVTCPDCNGHGDRGDRGCMRLHWVIGGFESGPHARPGNPVWACSLRNQCAKAGAAFLWKQNGEWLHEDERGADGRTADLLATDKSPLHQWPDGAHSVRVGKAAAGRLLDGVTHDGFPR